VNAITVSSKGQISIPKALRERLNLRKGSRLNVEIDRERIVLSKPADWRSLRGIAAGSDLLKAHEEDKEWERRRERVRS
jgi:AbrB family looped-hinge helix DNA binding protein